VKVIGTGHPAPADTKHLGTAVVPAFALAYQENDNREPFLVVESRAGLVWHVFGRTP
jgi:hypothetical protein